MVKKVYAKTKYVNMSPQKMRLVIDVIRGMNALEAVEILRYITKAAALPIRKTLASAIANAVNNYELDKYTLKIVEARIDEAPTFKRGRAVSKGRYHKILKRNSHIIIAVGQGEQKVEKSTKKQEAQEKNTKKEKKQKGKVRKVKTKKVQKKVAKKHKRMVKSNTKISSKTKN